MTRDGQRESTGDDRGMPAYWVVGGEYADMEFEEIAPGGKPERYGPFASYQDALREWKSRAWATVDFCLIRYRIVEEDA
jgi:hypothetical protein